MHTSNHYIILINRHQYFILQSKSINISFNQRQMQLVKQIDSKLGQTIPYYSKVSSLATGSCKLSCDVVNNLYQYSANGVKKMNKRQKQFKKDLTWVICQTTDDFLQFIQQKLEIECPEADEKHRMKRVMRIYKELKDKKLVLYFNKLVAFNKDLLKKGKAFGDKYITPICITVKAVVLVAKQLLMQIFTERIGQLKMTYKTSKDTIIMIWSADFKQQRLMQKIKQKLGSLKQLTVNYVQKGLEIKVSKKDLSQNYHLIMKLLSDIMKDVTIKSIEQLEETKNKTVNLYNSVLNRIRQKEIEIKMKILKDKTVQSFDEPQTQVKKEQKQSKLQNTSSKLESKQN